MKKLLLSGALLAALTGILAPASPVRAENAATHKDTDLARKMTNPIADLMMIPIQVNYDSHIGPAGDINSK